MKFVNTTKSLSHSAALPFAKKKICVALMASLSVSGGLVQAAPKLPGSNELPPDVQDVVDFDLSTNGRELTVTQSVNQLLIDWEDLNVGNNESLMFVRGTVGGQVLQGEMVSINRITGANPTEVLGSITSDGKVFLINPNGVIFGRNAEVNVQGLVASTLALGSDPAASSFSFGGQGGTLSVDGTINAQDLVLIGQDIQIDGGQISAPAGGRVFVLSGQAAQVQLDGDRLSAIPASAQSVRVLVSQAGMEQLQLVLQQDASGQLTALNTQNLPSGAGLQVNGAGVTVVANANGLSSNAETSIAAPGYDVAVDTASGLHASGNANTMNLQGSSIQLGGILGVQGIAAAATSGDVQQVPGSMVQAGGASSFDGQSVILSSDTNLISGSVNVNASNPQGQINIRSLQEMNVIATGAVQTVDDVVTAATQTTLQSASVLHATLSQTGSTTLEGSSVQLNGQNVIEGNLTVDARHGISQTGPLDVRGNTLLSGAVIALQNEANRFAGSVSATNIPLDPTEADQLAAELIALAESGPLSLTAIDLLKVVLPSVGTSSIKARAIEILGEIDGVEQASNVEGSLELIATDGSITQSAEGGALTVTETTSLTADEVELLNEDNQLEGLVTVDGTGDETDVTIKADSELAVEITDTTVVGDLELQGQTVTVGEAPTPAPAPNPAEPAPASVLEVNGTLTLTAEGSVEQTTALEVTGATTAAGNDIDLSNEANEFVGEVTLNATGQNATVEVQDASALTATVNSENSTTTVTLEADGALQASVSNTGETTLTGSSVQIGVGPAGAAPQSPPAVSGSEVSGNLTINAQGGSATQVESLQVAGSTTVNTSSTDLTNPGNALEGPVTVNADGAASSVQIDNGEALDLVVNGNGAQPTVTATAAGDLTVNLNQTGTATLTGANVIVGQEGSAGASSVQGTLTATATAASGSVSQNESLSVTETTTLNASSVQLDGAQNNLSGGVTVNLGDAASTSSLANAGDLAVTVNSPNAGASITVTAGGELDASLNAAGAVVLEGTAVQIGLDAPVAGTVSSVDGGLTINAVGTAAAGQSPTGAVTQTEQLSAGAGAQINAGTVTLANPANTVGGVLDINLAGTVQTAEVVAAGNLSLDLSGQPSSPSISSAQVTAGGTLTAQSAGVNTLDLNGANVVLGTVQAGTEDTAGSLNVNASGQVSQTGLISVRGSSSFTGDRIELGNADNLLTDLVSVAAPTVQLTANTAGANPLNVNVNGSGSVTLSAGHLNFTGSATGSQTVGSLTVNQTQVTTQEDWLRVLEGTTLNQSNANLDNALNDFMGAVQVNQQPGGVVNLMDANALNLGFEGSGALTASAGSVNLGGNATGPLSADSLTISADSITQSQAIDIEGLTDLTGQTITLNNDANSFGGGVEVLLTGAAPALTLHAQGDLTAQATSTPEADITLQATGSVALMADAANNLSIGGGNAQLGTLTGGAESIAVGGNLDVRVQNEITQLQALNVTGASVLSAQSVQLDNAGNVLAGGVKLESPDGQLNARIASGEQIAVNADGLEQLTLDASIVRFTGGPADTTAGAQAGAARQSINQLTVLNVSDLSQDDALTVDGALLVRGAAGSQTGSVDLNSETNVFSGSARVEDLAQADLASQGTLRASASNVGELSLAAGEVVFANQETEQISLLKVEANRTTQEESLQAQDVELTGEHIVLDDRDNRLTGTVSARLNGDAQVLTLASRADLTVEVLEGAADSDLSLSSRGNLAVNADQFGTAALTGDDVTIGAQTAAQVLIGESLNVAADGRLLQAEALAGEQVRIDATADSVLLDSSNQLSGNGAFTLNQPNGRVRFVNEGDFDLHVEGHRSDIEISQVGTLGLSFSNALNADVTATDIRLDGGRIAQRGTLALNADNTITQTAALDANGEVTLAGAQIVLDHEDNEFSDLVTLNREGAAATLVADSDLTVQSTSTLASLAVRGDDVELGSSSGAGSLTVTGDLNATATGRLSQAQALDVGGAANFSAETIELSNAPNRFASPVFLSAIGQAGLTGESLVIAGGSSVGGSLALSGGSVSQNGPLSVGGGLVVTAGAVSLDDPGNSFAGGVSIGSNGSGGPLSLSTDGSLDINLQGASASSANIRAGGNLSGQFDGVRNLNIQSGGLLNASASGFDSALFSAGQSADLTLGSGGSLSVSAGTIRLASAAGQGGTGQPASLSGNLTLNAQGLIHQDGALSVGGSTQVSGRSIQLTNSGNRFEGPVRLSGTGADANAQLNAEGDLDLSASGLAAVSAQASGQTTFQGSTGNLSLSADSIQFAGPSQLSSLDARANGAIQQSGSLAVSGDSNLQAQQVLLENASNDFGGELRIALSGGNAGQGQGAGAFNGTPNGALNGALSRDPASLSIAKVVDQNDLTLNFNGTAAQSAQLDARAGGSLMVAALGADQANLTARGQITQNGAVQVQGDLALKGSSVRLADSDNRLGQSVGLDVDGNAELVSDSLNLKDSRVDGNLELAALSGDITQEGGLTVGGSTQLSGRNILLDGENDFKGLVSADVQDRSGIVSIRDINDISLLVRDALALNVSAGGRASLNVGDIDDLEVDAGLVNFEQGLNLGSISVQSDSDVTQETEIEANQSLRVNAEGSILLQADNRILGPVVLNGLEVLFSNLELTRLAGLTATSGVLTTDKQLILQGDVILNGGRLDFVARGISTRVPRSTMADLLPQSADVFFSREVLDPLTASNEIGFRDATIVQESGRLSSSANSRMVFHSQGGSIVLNGSNKLDGGLQMLAGERFGENYASKGEQGQSLISVRNESALRIDGQGVEADLVSIQAPSLATGPASVIRARLPYDNLVLGESRSSPALILSINGIDEFLTGQPIDSNNGNAAVQSSLKPNERYKGINVNIGGANERRLGGFVTVLPFEGAQLRPGLVVYLEGPQQQAGYRVFYDGAGDPGRIPVSYNGLIPQLPAGVTALNAIAATVEQAGDQQRESVVRTENVGSRLRSGVVAEAKPGSPATSADEGLSKPELCDKASDSLQCEQP